MTTPDLEQARMAAHVAVDEFFDAMRNTIDGIHSTTRAIVNGHPSAHQPITRRLEVIRDGAS
jgi:hypothetical protein